MRWKISIVILAALSILFLGCQMPAGFGPARDLIGEDGENPPEGTWAPGSLSVEMDESRGQAVYVNENGVRFDVVAEEYPGGPVMRCVQVESFAEIPPSDDPEALPVKAIVAGTRDDGMLGAWEIHQDDSIHLTVGEDGEARCLTGSDPASALDGMETRFGWVYRVVGSALSTDKRTMIIAGYMENPNGFTFDSVELLPGTRVGVYWKVWRLPYGRFCIVSPPRVIGTWEKPVFPAGWHPGYNLARLLVQLKLFLLGRLETYLTDVYAIPATPDTPETPAIYYDPAENLFVVNGTDQDDFHAIAKIDRYGGIVINPIPPDLTVVSLFLEDPVTGEALGTITTDTQWYVKATVLNQGAGETAGIDLEFQVPDSTGSSTETLYVEDPDARLGVQKDKTYTIGPNRVEKEGTYEIVVTANSILKDADPTNDSASLVVEVTPAAPPPVLLPDLTVPVLSVSAVRDEATPVDEGKPLWLNDDVTITVQVANVGKGVAGPSDLLLEIVDDISGSVTPILTKDVSFKSLDPEKQVFSLTSSLGKVKDLIGEPAETPGDARTYTLVATADVNGAVVEANEDNNGNKLSLVVGIAKLVVGLEAAKIHAGQTVSATVENIGKGEALELAWEFGITGGKALLGQIDSLRPGVAEKIEFTPAVGPGVWEMFFALDGQTAATAELKVVYDRIVIETYPTVSGSTLPSGLDVALMDGPNDSSIQLAFSDGLTKGTYFFRSYNRIDYIPDPNEPDKWLDPGKEFYVRISPNTENPQRYAIRVTTTLSSSVVEYTDWYFESDPTSTDDAYEPDDSGGDSIPATLTVGGGLDEQRLNRYVTVTPKDVDWVKIILP